VFTGDKAPNFKGHLVGNEFIAGGNNFLSEDVLHAMADGFHSASGELADRLIAGIRAGEIAGVDRVRYSLSMLDGSLPISSLRQQK
jgi:uncharacterized Ntn-hydrolase superfamily protein